MRHRKSWTLLLFIVALFLFIPQQIFAKDSDIKINVKVGFAGKAKTGKGLPVNITIENNGNYFNGDVLVYYYPTYNMGGAEVLHIELPKNAKKSYTISLPGLFEEHYINYQNVQSIRLFKGGWKDGVEVDFTGEKKLSPMYVDLNQKMLGVLSKDQNRVKQLNTLTVNGNQIETVILSDAIMPTEATGLEMLDYLVIDEYAISQLNHDVQQAIKEWIQNGGVLIVGAAPDLKQSFGMLYDLLPMKVTKEQTTSNLMFLQKIAKDTTPIPFKSLPLLIGETHDQASIAVGNSQVPLVVRKDIGNGEVWQTAFSLGDEPLSSWKGYGDWMNWLLSQSNSDQLPHFSQYGPNLYDTLFYEFAEVNEYFPSSQFSIGNLIVILLGYIVIIVPLLYFVLKKMDKREQAWWIIPTIALITSSGIFVVGAKDRIAYPQLSQMGVYQSQFGDLNGYYAATMLSNRSGNYPFTFPKGSLNVVPSSRSLSSSQSIELHRHALSEDLINKEKIIFPNVEYWSTRSFIGKSYLKNVGEFTVDLTLKNKKIVGTIQNKFPYDFEEIFIWTGNKVISVGSLPKGKTIDILQVINRDYLTAPLELSRKFQQPLKGKDIEKIKKEQLQVAASTFFNTGRQSDNQPVVFGFTKEQLNNIELEGKKEKVENLALVYQPFEIKGGITGPFTVKNDMLNFSISVIQGHLSEKLNRSRNELIIENGVYDLTIQLPTQIAVEKATFGKMDMTLYGNKVNYSIFNLNSGEFEPVSIENQKIEMDKQLKHYISPEGKIVLRIHKQNYGDPVLRIPSITVKGDVRP